MCSQKTLIFLPSWTAANISDGELGIEGYALYRGNHSSGSGGPGKGAALCVKDNLNHSACPIFDNVAFDCSAWCTVLLLDGKRLLVGVVYRSPSSTKENNNKMLDILRIASATNIDYLLVWGLQPPKDKLGWKPVSGRGHIFYCDIHGGR